MDITTDWNKIRVHFNKSFKSNLHVSVGSVNSNHQPTVTPIGSLFLNSDQTGFYFEKFPSKLPQHAKSNNHICVLAVNSNKWFWLKSVFYGKFYQYPAIKLYGQLGNKRDATQHELSRFYRRMRWTKGLKGDTYMWREMAQVREIIFTRAEKINLGAMTKDL